MTLIVDASVAVAWYVAEPESEAARALLESRQPLVAPELLIAEVCNALWKRVTRGEAIVEQARLASQELPRVFEDLASLRGLCARATEIALALKHPVYDCFYLALAEERDASMVTSDRRLLAKIAGTPWQVRVKALTTR